MNFSYPVQEALIVCLQQLILLVILDGEDHYNNQHEGPNDWNDGCQKSYCEAAGVNHSSCGECVIAVPANLLQRLFATSFVRLIDKY